MNAPEISRTNEILRGVVGSTAHGTAVDGQDDRDEMGHDDYLLDGDQ